MGAPESNTAAMHVRQQLSESAETLAEMPAPATSEAVLAGVVAGERWAHAALYDQLFPVVARTLHTILRDKSGDYEDLVQVSFERIVRTLTSDRGAQVLNLAGWAGSIAAHVALDALRRRMRERRLFERDSGGEGVAAPSLERQLEARKRLEWLQYTLSRMKPDQAQTILLHDVLGHGLVEVAAIMGVTVAAAQRRLSRGHQELMRRAKIHGIKGGA